jgi:hypothetical protein
LNAGEAVTKHVDKYFGELTQDPNYGEWTVDLEQIRYIFESLEALPHGQRLIRDLASWETYAAQEMLQGKNSSWPDEDGDENELMITAEAFAERMTLNSVTVQNDGSLSFWFDDGDLFYGHAILVEYDGEDWRGSSIQG